MQISDLERRIVAISWTIAVIAMLAAISITFLAHANTLAFADPIIRWLAPHASAEDVTRLHILGRKLGHFLIPAGVYLALVLGPLHNRPKAALTLCVLFAVLDETLQTLTLGRSGSIYDVSIDVAGALCGFFAYSAIAGDHLRGRPTGAAKRSR